MVNEKTYSCDSCHRIFNSPVDVRHSVAIDTPDGLILWSDLCAKCSFKATEILEDSFKKEPKVKQWSVELKTKVAN